MGPIEIIIIVLLILIFGTMIGVYIYKKIKHIPTSTCDCGVKKTNKSKLIEEYRKAYPKDEKCSCGKDIQN